MIVLWDWLWGNIQSLWSLIELFFFIIVGMITWVKFFKGADENSKNSKNLYDYKDLNEIYYEYLDNECDKLKLNLVDREFSQNQSGLSLSEVYLDQKISVPQVKTNSEPSNFIEDTQPLMTALEHLDTRRVVIIGTAGSGKSSFINHITHLIIKSYKNNTTNIPSFMLNRPVVRLLIREVSNNSKTQEEKTKFLWNEIKKNVRSNIEKRLLDTARTSLNDVTFEEFWQIFQENFIQNNGILLLDGLDELTKENIAESFRESIISFSNEKINKNISIIITTRPSSYEKDNQKLHGFWQATIEPMNEQQIHEFIKQWHQIIHKNNINDSEEKARFLMEDILDDPYLREMSTNPLLLTLLIGLDSTGKRLKGTRTETYNEIIDLLLKRWNQNLTNNIDSLSKSEQEGMLALTKYPDLLREALQKTAYETYETHNQSRHSALEFNATIIVGNLYGKLKKSNYDHDKLVYFLQNRSALLVAGKTNDKLQFSHRSFHEYLAAKYLLSQQSWQEKIIDLLNTDHEWWKEVFLFIIKDIANTRYGMAVSFLYDELLSKYKRTEYTQQKLLILAATAASEIELRLMANRHTHIGLLKFLREELTILLSEYTLSVDERANAGRLIGILGDYRSGVTIRMKDENNIYSEFKERKHTIPDIDWQEIPACDFIMGTNDSNAYPDEKPEHTVKIKRFFISRYPITNAQYRCFLEANMYNDTSFWRNEMTDKANNWRNGDPDIEFEKTLENREEKYREDYKKWIASDKNHSMPSFWLDKMWNIENHPVVGISWFEATAYCFWLNSIFDILKPQNNTNNMRIRLPTEAEWEYAARGEEHIQYAWGNNPDPKMGNYGDTGIGRTSSVGIFPPSKVFNLFDITGNTWEWCCNRYSLYSSSDTDTTTNGFHVLRGGSWSRPKQFVRSTYRFRTTPNYRHNYMGFRIVIGDTIEN